MPQRPRRVALGWIDWTRFGDPARGGGTGRFRKWARSLGPRTLQQVGETGIGIHIGSGSLTGSQRSAMCPSRHPATGRGTARLTGAPVTRQRSRRPAALHRADLVSRIPGRRGPGRAVHAEHARPARARGARPRSHPPHPGGGAGAPRCPVPKRLTAPIFI